MAALRHKEQTGEGQFVCVPMLETFTGFLMAEHLYNQTYIPPTGKYGHVTTITPHRKPYRTKDGWLSVLPASQAQSLKFLELGGIPNAYETERFLSAPKGSRVDAYYAMMDEAALAHTTDEWMLICAENSIPAMRANEVSQIVDDPQLKQTLFETRDLPGEGPYRAMKPGLRFAKTPVSIRRDPPQLGADTADVLAEFGIEADDA